MFEIGSIVFVKPGVLNNMTNKKGTIIKEKYREGPIPFWWVKFSNVKYPMWFSENELILKSRVKIDFIWEE